MRESLSTIIAAASAPKRNGSGTLHWVASLGAPGVFGVSFVDASIVPLAIPGSTDLLLLWLIAGGGNPFLLVGFAVAGTLAGGLTTWRIGKKGGQAAIKRYVPPRWQGRVHGWSQRHPFLALFLPAILPPPIPLAPFLLAAGALGSSWKRFATLFGAGRVVRYGLIAWLAVAYGRGIIHLWSAALERWSGFILWTFFGLTAAGVAFSVWNLRHKGQKLSQNVAFEPFGTPGPG
ncbi:MAG TPA: VTT domain-containing protein [Terracidiphilus sp.]